jgi:hypothetical protein
VIVYEQSGGFAGKTEGWSIYEDGRVVALDGRKGQASPADVAALLARVNKASFFSMRDSYITGDTCCDRFTYRLTVRQADKTKTVETIDAAEGQPSELGPLLGEVRRLATTAAGK